jgi:hypothetical protein
MDAFLLAIAGGVISSLIATGVIAGGKGILSRPAGSKPPSLPASRNPSGCAMLLLLFAFLFVSIEVLAQGGYNLGPLFPHAVHEFFKLLAPVK